MSELEQLKAENENLKAELTEKTDALNADWILKLESRCDSLRGELATWKSIASGIEKKLAAVMDERDRLQSDITRLTAQSQEHNASQEILLRKRLELIHDLTSKCAALEQIAKEVVRIAGFSHSTSAVNSFLRDVLEPMARAALGKK